jgi:hypothetical protein
MSDHNSNGSSILWLYIMMTIMLVAGAGNTIFGKLQFEQTDNDGNKYRHPYFMAINVFGAGALANLFY